MFRRTRSLHKGTDLNVGLTRPMSGVGLVPLLGDTDLPRYQPWLRFPQLSAALQSFKNCWTFCMGDRACK